MKIRDFPEPHTPVLELDLPYWLEDNPNRIFRDVGNQTFLWTFAEQLFYEATNDIIAFLDREATL